MPYNDAKAITNLYLNSNGQTSFEVDVNDFMQNGGGRFAVGRQFDILHDFFNNKN